MAKELDPHGSVEANHDENDCQEINGVEDRHPQRLDKQVCPLGGLRAGYADRCEAEKLA